MRSNLNDAAAPVHRSLGLQVLIAYSLIFVSVHCCSGWCQEITMQNILTISWVNEPVPLGLSNILSVNSSSCTISTWSSWTNSSMRAKNKSLRAAYEYSTLALRNRHNLLVRPAAQALLTHQQRASQSWWWPLRSDGTATSSSVRVHLAVPCRLRHVNCHALVRVQHSVLLLCTQEMEMDVEDNGHAWRSRRTARTRARVGAASREQSAPTVSVSL